MRKTVIAFAFSLIMVLLMIPVAVNADMNSDEMGVVRAASGTFTYEGVQYVATSSALAELRSYLYNNVDLTPAQASKAKGMMRNSSNIRSGIEGGNLVPVSGSSTVATDPEKKVKAGKGIVRLIERDAVVEVTGSNGDVIYSSHLPIKNTGFSFNGILVALAILAGAAFCCIYLIKKRNLFACEFETGCEFETNCEVKTGAASEEN